MQFDIDGYNSSRYAQMQDLSIVVDASDLTLFWW
jgi:hypothetical protein